MKINILAIAILALIAAGCSKNDETPKQDNFPADRVIRVAPTVSSMTRGGATSDNLTNFGLFIEDQWDDKFSYSVYMEKSDGIFKSYNNKADKKPLQMLWQNLNHKVHIRAYAPYNSEATGSSKLDGEVMADQSVAENIVKSDFIYYRKLDFHPAYDTDDNWAIPVSLKHKNTKLVVTITLGTEFNDVTGNSSINPITSVTLKETHRLATYDLDDGTVTVNEDVDKETITMFNESYTPSTTTNAKAVYECIVIPQYVYYTDFVVSITINGIEYSYMHTKNITLYETTQYNLPLTLGQNRVTAGNMTITPWTNNDGGSYTTD